MKSASPGKLEKNFETRMTPISELKPHPKNYRTHPADQLDHLMKSIQEHGFYRNIIAAKDGFILAGHGVVEAAKKLGLTEVPVLHVPIESTDPKAMKILIGDNELGHLGERNDRALSELLKNLRNIDVGELIGTGYDDQMLANLLFITRPASEIADINEAEHWVGMPVYGDANTPLALIMHFRTEDDRAMFVTDHHLKLVKKEGKTWSSWWPDHETDDASSVKFQA